MAESAGLKRRNFHFTQTGDADGDLFDGDIRIGRIRQLRLAEACPAPGESSFLSPTVPLPLFWWQYAHHEHPERNAGVHTRLDVDHMGTESLALICTGRNESESILSVFRLTIYRDRHSMMYLYEVDAELTVADGASWRVTHNPDHGEVECCNLWPAQSFSPDASEPKRYQACLWQSGSQRRLIPHHHLETDDKHNITLQSGDRLSYVLEDRNPTLEILSQQPLVAGLCAYMWDLHVGIRICTSPQDVVLAGGTRFHVRYRLSCPSRNQLADDVAQASPPDRALSAAIPVYKNGVNDFDPVDPDVSSPQWPWTPEPASSLSTAVELSLDDQVSRVGKRSLKIQHAENTRSHWIMTALGPAFGWPAFANGCRLRLSAAIRTLGLVGESRIALRYHLTGREGLFSPQTYSRVDSNTVVSGSREWTRIEVTTPPLDPAPDRVHLILEQNGTGITWFDEVLFETLTPQNRS